MTNFRTFEKYYKMVFISDYLHYILQVILLNIANKPSTCRSDMSDFKKHKFNFSLSTQPWGYLWHDGSQILKTSQF